MLVLVFQCVCYLCFSVTSVCGFQLVVYLCFPMCSFYLFLNNASFIFVFNIKKVNRKVQEEPQAEAAANPRHQEEEKK